MLRLQHDDGIRWQDGGMKFRNETDGDFSVICENRGAFSYRQVSFGAYVLEMIVSNGPMDHQRHYRGKTIQVNENGMTFTPGEGASQMEMRIFHQPPINGYVIQEGSGPSADLSINANGRSSFVIGTFADGATDRFSLIHHSADALKFRMNDVLHAIVVPLRPGDEKTFKGAGRISQDALLYVTRFSGDDISTMWAVTNQAIERFGKVQ